MGKVIYITGAPATGKSTLCRALSKADPSIRMFCYSERLRDHVNQRADQTVDEAGIREASARVVHAEDVDAVDDLLRAESLFTHSRGQYLVIDSHPVTKEDFGFRVTPFSVGRLQALGVEVIICLYADPEVLARRIRDDAQGRPLPTEFELALHVQLQVAVATQYSMLVGRPCYVLNSDVSRQELVAQVQALAGLPRRD